MVKLLVLMLALLVIAALLAVGAATSRQPRPPTTNLPPSFAFTPNGCYGNLTVRLHSNHLLLSEPFSLFIGNPSHSFVNGTLEERRNLDLTATEPCGPYTVYVSWKGGPWEGQTVTVEGGKTASVYFASG